MTQSLGLLSIVVPTYNTRDLTLRCLGAVNAEGDPNLELILVDDGGSDDTARAVAAAFPSTRIIRRERQGGFTAAANDGLSQARGEILFLLNSDTSLEQGALARLRSAFEQRPRLGVAGAALCDDDGQSQWSGGHAPTPFWLFLNASGLPALLGRIPGYRALWPSGGARRGRVDWVSGAAMALRRSAWERIGALDDSFAFYGQDVLVCLRARGAGFDVALLKEVRVRHLGGGTMRRRPGATASGLHPGFLWTDLLRVVRKRSGDETARRAARFVIAGIAVRSAIRRVESLFVPAAAREAWRHDSEAYAQGRAQVLDWTRALEETPAARP